MPGIKTPITPASASREDSNYKWKVLATVLFGLFMVILDTTAVNVAFQTLREDFGGDLNQTQWIISIYVLALGISTPLAGFLADRLGARRVYLSGLVVFVAGSLACGLAHSLPMLIVARALQGVGGGIALPLGTALLLQAFPVKEQGMALGYFGVAALVAPALGPILGGWLVDHGLWRVVFFINPPIGAVGITLGLRFLREHKPAQRPPFDWPGIVTEMIGFGAILYAASIAANQGWTSPQTLLWFGIGVAGLIAFVIVELFLVRSPLLNLRLFANRIFLNASVLGYVSTVALFGAEFLMPVYLQALRGRSALDTGFILLPMAITGGIFVTLSGRLYDRVGPRPLMAVGFTTLVVNTWQLSLLQADTPIAWILFLLALRGLALGLTVQTTMVTALSVVPRSNLARGTSLINATRLVVQSIGVAMLATVLASTISPQLRQMQEQFAAAPGSHSNQTAAGLCEPAVVAHTGPDRLPAPARFSAGPGVGSKPRLALGPVGQGDPPPDIDTLRHKACQENVAGFERAYRITFYAALVALALGLMLPGWPMKWEGRQMAGEPPASH